MTAASLSFDSDDPTHVDRLPPRVLVVEDDGVVCGALQRVLARWGYLVDGARDLASARRLAIEWRPRVIILDLILGEEDGGVLIDELREALGARSPSFLVCSGALHREMPEGASACIAKPVHPRELVQTVHDLTRPAS